MKSNYYDRDGLPIANVTEWSELRNRAGIRVARTDVGASCVSTVWLGLDCNFTGIGAPVIFETMIFGGPSDEYQERYTTELDAMRGHLRIVETLQAGGVL